MRKIEFVTISGEPWKAAPSQAPKKPDGSRLKRVHDPKKAKAHYGFEVVGIEVSRLEAARRDDADRRARRGLPQAGFDDDAWLNRTKPRRAIARIYHVPEAAEQAAGMLLAGGGWARVRVVEILKG